MEKRVHAYRVLVIILAVSVVFVALRQDASSTQQTSALVIGRTVNLRSPATLNSGNSWAVVNQAISTNQNPLRSPTFPDTDWILTDLSIGVGDFCMDDVSGGIPECVSIFVFTSTGQSIARVVLNESNQQHTINFTTGIPIGEETTLMYSASGLNFTGSDVLQLLVIVHGFDVP